jgi:hypothetical protein
VIRERTRGDQLAQRQPKAPSSSTRGVSYSLTHERGDEGESYTVCTLLELILPLPAYLPDD